MPPESAVEIAVLKEQILGIREQQKAHAENTDKLFAKLFEEIDELKAAMNRGKGVLAASLSIAGILGAGLMALVKWWGQR